MTKAEQQNRLKTSRRIARIADIVCNCPKMALHINNANILGVYTGAETIKYIKVTVEGIPEPIKAAYIAGQKSKSLEDMENKVEELFHQYEKERLNNEFGV